MYQEHVGHDGAVDIKRDQAGENVSAAVTSYAKLAQKATWEVKQALLNWVLINFNSDTTKLF